MQKSESIAALAGALAKAQSEMQGAKKDAENPFFKSKYADLSSVWDACRAALTKNGLSVIQTPSTEITETHTIIRVGTILCHSSGEWISEELSAIPGKDDPQGIGSCVTYLRRYALSAFTGVAPEDDDGNAASQGNGKPAQRTAPPKPSQKAAEVGELKQGVADVCKLLNKAGDTPPWTAKKVDEFAVQEFGAKVDVLELEPLRDLLKKLSLKLDAVKAAAKGGDLETEIARKAKIAAIQGKATDKQIHEALVDMADKAGRTDVPRLVDLSLDQLVTLEHEHLITF